ncbi:3-oxoacyl-[acyl-carrier protein] reductase [Arthrobacter sp. B3I9]|uniref:SDR family oxidoreductase n=1 Tax=Arthrobacter sp. B3I9 TaxID=3042270 RepID=UPI0027906808|nr:SDR family oxidoreductase [Arthrobacter sp. B3I9]MDQ0850728.1 3-oxoacyl-[acyl-carrier protein] reductase [Arthrobacter sp. B3I9]
MNARRALNVVVAGGSGPSGIATARALHDAGHTVFTVGSDGPRIEAAAAEAGGGITPVVCDLASLAEVRALHAGITARAGRVDGVIHLVGGWRGANGIADQSDEDWDFLESSAITTVRNVTRVFYEDLAASGTGRFAMVSSTAVSSPTAATASYVAAKAAAEAWTLAVAEGFRRDQTAAGEPGGAAVSAGASTSGQEPAGAAAQRSAAVVLVVKALVDAGMRAKSPQRRFPGFTDVEDLAAAAVGLFTTPASELNGQRLLLAP